MYQTLDVRISTDDPKGRSFFENKELSALNFPVEDMNAAGFDR